MINNSVIPPQNDSSGQGMNEQAGFVLPLKNREVFDKEKTFSDIERLMEEKKKADAVASSIDESNKQINNFLQTSPNFSGSYYANNLGRSSAASIDDGSNDFSYWFFLPLFFLLFLFLKK